MNCFNPRPASLTLPPVQPVRFGILGAARIARKNWQAIFHTGNAVVAAVASREAARAAQFIAEQQAVAPFAEPPRVCASYEELLAAPDLEAVYIPLPTALRKPWVIRAAQAGKHVLCEKPCAVNAADLREMLDACERHGVQFMDGVMFMHNPRLERLRAAVDDASAIGPLRRITAAFSFLGPDDFLARNVRAQTALEPSGCLGDLGWYCLRLALWVMRGQLPERVGGRTLLDVAGRRDGPGLPLDFAGELHFPGGVSAGFHCSFRANQQQWAMISGANGFVRIPDFVLPNSANAVAWEVNYQPVMKARTGLYLETETGPQSQETNQFRNFAAQIRTGRLNSDWPQAAWRTQLLMDACLRSARADGALVEVG